jgi:hypothetical protein
MMKSTFLGQMKLLIWKISMISSVQAEDLSEVILNNQISKKTITWSLIIDKVLVINTQYIVLCKEEEENKTLNSLRN